MGKKNKTSSNSQPNAPYLDEILLDSPTTNQQPPHNPYYPQLSQENTGSSEKYFSCPPPPYSDLSRPRTQQQQANNSVRMGVLPSNRAATIVAGNSRYESGDDAVPLQTPSRVVIQQPIIYNNRNRDKRNGKIRSFNNNTIILVLIVIGLSVYAESLYRNRPCVESFTIYKYGKDGEVTIKMLREDHFSVALISLAVGIVCILKCPCTNTDSHGCYLLIMFLLTLLLTLMAAKMAYLSLYNPCTLELMEIFKSAVKTGFSKIFDNLPEPVERRFGETTVFHWAQEDRAGVMIFLINLFVFISYLSSFLSVISLC